ncbi:MAG: T9SS type A sorting domain-containing protein [Flavipsychrobacter sp.]|nr:T9SS type A sorting domain-containing protein [Flavipsychrobacter sp.]
MTGNTTTPSSSVIQVYDGNYVTLHHSSRTVTKIDPQLNVMWQYQHVITDWFTNYYPQGDIIETRDSGLVVAGYIRFGEQPVMPASWLVKIDKDGVLEVEKSNEVFFIYHCIKPTLDGKYIILGTMNPITEARTNRLIKSDSFQIWETDITHTTLDVSCNLDSTFVLCGPTGFDTLADAYISKREKDGQLSVISQFGGSSYDNFVKIVPTADTGYIALGLTNSNDGDATGNHGKFDIWVVKFRQDTSVHPLPPPVVTSVNEVAAIDNITVYPNPTQGQVRVTLPPACASVQAAVYNMVGQPLSLPAARAGDQLLIDLSLQPAGMYQLELMIGHERKSYRVLLLP